MQHREASAVVLATTSPEQTRQIGVLLGGLLRAGDVVLLEGDLGAGKTVLAQGIGAGLGVTQRINSPTFTLLKEYVGRVPFYHFDLYRIEDPAELFALGFAEYFGGDGVAVVEWSERAGSTPTSAPWPAEWLRIRLHAPGAEERALRLTAAGARGAALLAAAAEALAPWTEGSLR